MSRTWSGRGVPPPAAARVPVVHLAAPGRLDHRSRLRPRVPSRQVFVVSEESNTVVALRLGSGHHSGSCLRGC